MGKTKENQSVIRAAGAMSLGTLSSRILGFVRDMVLAAYFSNTTRDAFIVAFRLPNLFRRLLGEGALSVSFIPVYIEQMTIREGESPEEAKLRSGQVKAGIFSLLFTVALILTGLGLSFMDSIVGLLVSGEGFMSIPGKYELTVDLARWMFGYLFLVTLYAFGMSILNAHKKFFLPALAPAFFNLSFIVFSLLPNKWFQFTGQQVAIGVIVGGVIQVLMVVYPLWKKDLLPRFKWNFSPEVKTILVNMIPGLIGMGVLQLMAIVNVNFASRLGEGTHSYIYFADRILELPQSLLAISLGAALLPTLSEKWARGHVVQMRQTAESHIKILLFLALPCAVGMYTIAQPIVEVLFERGSFTSVDSVNTALIIQCYSLLLISSGVYKVVVPNFYAIKNTWIPAATTACGLVLHVVLAGFLMDMWGIQGLVLSMIAASVLNLTLILTIYTFKFGALNWASLVIDNIKLVPALGVMSLITIYFYPWLITNGEGAFFRVIALFLTIGLSVVVYFGVGVLFKNPECQKVLSIFKRRLG